MDLNKPETVRTLIQTLNDKITDPSLDTAFFTSETSDVGFALHQTGPVRLTVAVEDVELLFNAEGELIEHKPIEAHVEEDN